jgi:hypothetical protein
MARYDIAVGSDKDLLFNSSGDFDFVPSDQQHIEDTIYAWPGWWKEYPLDGVAVEQYVKSSSGLQLLARKIKIELNSDEYGVNSPILSLDAAGLLKIDPNVTDV